MLFVLIAVPITAVFLSRKINQRISKREMEITIITANEHKQYIKDFSLDEDTLSITHNEKEYSGTIKDAWKKQKNLMDRLKGVQRYLMVFFEWVDDTKDKTKTIQPINKALVPETTSEILMKIKKYRGVNPAIDSQYSDSGGGLSNWMLIIVIVAVLIMGLLAAFQLGLITIPGAAEPQANIALIWGLVQ